MPATSEDYGPLDETLHLADGSHRSDPPFYNETDLETWQARRKAHLDRHIDDAKAANADIKDDPLLHTFVDQVSQLSEGRIFVLQVHGYDGVTSYRFAHLAGTYTREEAMREMIRIIRSDLTRGM